MADKLTIERYIAECFVKCANVVLSSRVYNGSRAAPDRRSSRWFLLEVEDTEGAANDLEAWRKDMSQPMVIEIFMPNTALSNARNESSSSGRQTSELLLERWTLQYQRKTLAGQGPVGTPVNRSTIDEAAVYKRLIILVRSLFSYVRVLPAYRMYRACKRHQGRLCRLDYRILRQAQRGSIGGARSVDTPRLQQFSFAPVDTPSGCFKVSVEYQPSATVHVLEQSTVPLTFPHIISDYIGGAYPHSAPSAHRAMRPALSASVYEFAGTALPLPDPSSSPPISTGAGILRVQRSLSCVQRHSWSSKDVQVALVPVSGSSGGSASPSSGGGSSAAAVARRPSLAHSPMQPSTPSGRPPLSPGTPRSLQPQAWVQPPSPFTNFPEPATSSAAGPISTPGPSLSHQEPEATADATTTSSRINQNGSTQWGDSGSASGGSPAAHNRPPQASGAALMYMGSGGRTNRGGLPSNSLSVAAPTVATPPQDVESPPGRSSPPAGKALAFGRQASAPVTIPGRGRHKAHSVADLRTMDGVAQPGVADAEQLFEGPGAAPERHNTAHHHLLKCGEAARQRLRIPSSAPAAARGMLGQMLQNAPGGPGCIGLPPSTLGSNASGASPLGRSSSAGSAAAAGALVPQAHSQGRAEVAPGGPTAAHARAQPQAVPVSATTVHAGSHSESSGSLSAFPMSCSPQLPFAFTPSGHSLASLAEHHAWTAGAPLIPPSPPVISGRDISALATIRRPSWSSRSSSFDVATPQLQPSFSVSPLQDLFDCSLLSSSTPRIHTITASPLALLQGIAGSTPSAAPPPATPLVTDESESDLLPFALDTDGLAGQPPEGTPRGGSYGGVGVHAGDHDAAVGAFMALLAEAPALAPSMMGGRAPQLTAGAGLAQLAELSEQLRSLVAQS